MIIVMKGQMILLLLLAAIANTWYCLDVFVVNFFLLYQQACFQSQLRVALLDALDWELQVGELGFWVGDDFESSVLVLEIRAGGILVS